MTIIKRLITVALIILTCILLTVVTAAAAAVEDNDAESASAEIRTAEIQTAETPPTETLSEEIPSAGLPPVEIASAETNEADDESVSGAGSDISAAAKLYLLGLFRGVGAAGDGSPNLATDRAPTRAEAVVMIVRLIGGEAEALEGDWVSPFQDVPDWAKPYVGYAYEKNLVYGVNGGIFAGNRAISATEYITLILRSLCYTSGVDFEWDTAWVLSDEIGITGGRYSSATRNFSRGNAAEILFNALGSKQKGSDRTLCSILIDEGVFTEADANALGVGVIAETPVPMAMVPRRPDIEQTPGASEMEREVFILVNKEREKVGLKAFVWNSELAAVARAHSMDMSTRNYFNHISPEGLKPSDRKRSAGLVFRYSAENIARGYRTAETVVAAWMSSPSHKSAILTEYATSIGVGVYSFYWTMNLIG